MATAALYREQVLAHARAPGHSTPLDHADARAMGDNALCGDHLEVQLALTDERISGYAFHAEACVLVRAVASMLGDRLLGLDRAGVHDLARRFERLLQGAADDTDTLGDLAVFVDLAAHPARRKCARLPLETVLAALAGRATATTEEA